MQKYRQKHKEVYREKDALRKSNYRQKMKTNPIALQRVKESIATATAANLVTEQSDDSAFSQAHIRSKSIEKVAKTLPKSPRQRKEVISALANKLKLRIKSTQSKAGIPKNELIESEKWLKNVLDKPDITYVTQGRKDHRYVGKVDGKSQ